MTFGYVLYRILNYLMSRQEGINQKKWLDSNYCINVTFIALLLGIGPNFSAIVYKMSDVQNSGIRTNNLLASAGK